MSVDMSNVAYTERASSMGDRQTAVVLEPGPVATVMIKREPMCGECGLCTTVSRTGHVVTAIDPVGAKRGQRVLLEASHRDFLRAAALGFGLPLLGLLAGLLTGLTWIGGLLGLTIAYLALHWVDRHLWRPHPPVIVAICEEGGGREDQNISGRDPSCLQQDQRP
ncbi:MAG TPA: SoxR reducing system RseC family protein [Firmicutes bacterium]|nr:SoxR reducing system RseC family protein [Bacillota bacterium]